MKAAASQGFFASGSAFAVAIGAVALAGFALGWSGWSVGQKRAPAATVAKRNPATTSALAAATPASEPLGSFDDEAAATRVDAERRVRLSDAVDALDRTGLLAALAHERERLLATRGDGQLPAEALLARLAALDPPAAAAWMAQMYQDERETLRSAWVRASLDPWMERDPAAALAWGRGLTNTSLRSVVNEEMLGQLAARDPAWALRELTAPGGRYSSQVSMVFNRLAETDLKLAREQAFRVLPGDVSSAVGAVVQTWSKEGNLAEIYAWAEKIPSSTVRASAMSTIYENWGKRDPAAAAAWLTTHGAATLVENSSSVAGAWAARDPAAALAWSRGLPTSVRKEAAQSVVFVWAADDPRAAALGVASTPGLAQPDLVTMTARYWASTDRDQALAWAESLPAGDTRRGALAGVCGAWSESEPRACLEYLNRPGNEAALKECREDVIRQWVNSEPDEVWRYARALEDPVQRDSLTTDALAQVASNDPTRASTLFAQLSTDAQKKAAASLANQWAQTDPGTGAQWLAALPPGTARGRAWSAFTSAWGSYDPVGAGTWLYAQPSDKVRDASMVNLLRFQAEEFEGRDAVRLARSIPPGETRTDALLTVAQRWLTNDRPAAAAWIQRAKDLTDEQRKTLLDTSNEAATP